jgi:PBP1b-binding outer membrane lipoprotein LpoB
MKSLILFAALLLVFAGCSSPSAGTSPGRGQPVATIQTQAPNTEASPANKEIRCHIHMIDGVDAEGSDRLHPGHHRVIVALGAGENEHVGDVDLLIPAAKNYRLKAERDDEMFQLSLIETDTGKVAATSAAPVSQVMKFKVFVGQK